MDNCSDIVDFKNSKDSTNLSELLFLITLAVTVQILDGMLTSFGVSVFGPGIEGNPIIRNLILNFGCTTALCSVKLFAASASIIVCVGTIKRKWAGLALRGLILIYIFLAIIPWTAILTNHVICQ